jgi:hypothetical protein
VQGKAALELLSLGREFRKPVVPCETNPGGVCDVARAR